MRRTLFLRLENRLRGDCTSPRGSTSIPGGVNVLPKLFRVVVSGFGNSECLLQILVIRKLDALDDIPSIVPISSAL
jgi:hypothetical protein